MHITTPTTSSSSSSSTTTTSTPCLPDGLCMNRSRSFYRRLSSRTATTVPPRHMAIRRVQVIIISTWTVCRLHSTAGKCCRDHMAMPPVNLQASQAMQCKGRSTHTRTCTIPPCQQGLCKPALLYITFSSLLRSYRHTQHRFRLRSTPQVRPLRRYALLELHTPRTHLCLPMSPALALLPTHLRLWTDTPTTAKPRLCNPCTCSSTICSHLSNRLSHPAKPSCRHKACQHTHKQA